MAPPKQILQPADELPGRVASMEAKFQVIWNLPLMPGSVQHLTIADDVQTVFESRQCCAPRSKFPVEPREEAWKR